MTTSSTTTEPNPYAWGADAQRQLTSGLQADVEAGRRRLAGLVEASYGDNRPATTADLVAAVPWQPPAGGHELCDPSTCRNSIHPRRDAVAVFDQLVREVDAGRALVVLSTEGDERRRAALDALALARDLLDDARDLLGGQA